MPFSHQALKFHKPLSQGVWHKERKWPNTLRVPLRVYDDTVKILELIGALCGLHSSDKVLNTKHQTGPSAKDLASRHCPGEEDESGHRLGPILQRYVQRDGDADKSTPPSNPGDFMGLEYTLR